MPVSLSSILGILRPAVDVFRNELPEGIIDIDLQVDFVFDQLNLIICVKGEGIYKHAISRAFLEDHYHNEIYRYIRDLVMKHIPCATPMQVGAEEYDDILQAQEIMAKISPQS